MNTQLTRIVKTNNGWEASTDWDLNAERFLRIRTAKNYRGQLGTAVQAYKKDGGGFVSFILFQDFNKVLKTSTARCTEKAVTEQHGFALAEIEPVIAEARAFYKLDEVAA